MPHVIRPATARSANSDAVTARALPGLLREHGGRGRVVLGPDHLELAVLPLADGAWRGDVLAALEADGADDGLELGGGDVIAQGLAVQADLLDRLLHDLQARPAVTAGPAIRLLAELLHVGVEVRLGAGAGLHVP